MLRRDLRSMGPRFRHRTHGRGHHRIVRIYALQTAPNWTHQPLPAQELFSALVTFGKAVKNAVGSSPGSLSEAERSGAEQTRLRGTHTKLSGGQDGGEYLSYNRSGGRVR